MFQLAALSWNIFFTIIAQYAFNNLLKFPTLIMLHFNIYQNSAYIYQKKENLFRFSFILYCGR